MEVDTRHLLLLMPETLKRYLEALPPEYDNVNREMIYDRPTAWDEYKED